MSSPSCSRLTSVSAPCHIISRCTYRDTCLPGSTWMLSTTGISQIQSARPSPKSRPRSRTPRHHCLPRHHRSQAQIRRCESPGGGTQETGGAAGLRQSEDASISTGTQLPAHRPSRPWVRQAWGRRQSAGVGGWLTWRFNGPGARGAHPWQLSAGVSLPALILRKS